MQNHGIEQNMIKEEEEKGQALRGKPDGPDLSQHTIDVSRQSGMPKQALWEIPPSFIVVPKAPYFAEDAAQCHDLPHKLLGSRADREIRRMICAPVSQNTTGW